MFLIVIFGSLIKYLRDCSIFYRITMWPVEHLQISWKILYILLGFVHRYDNFTQNYYSLRGNGFFSRLLRRYSCLHKLRFVEIIVSSTMKFYIYKNIFFVYVKRFYHEKCYVIIWYLQRVWYYIPCTKTYSQT